MDDPSFGTLGRLPPELRNSVYELVLGMGATIVIESDETDPTKTSFSLDERAEGVDSGPALPLPKEMLAILGTSKEIRSECGNYFFIINKFKCVLAQDQNCNTPAEHDDQTLDLVSKRLSKQQLAPFNHFLQIIGPEKASAMTHMLIDFGTVIDEMDLDTRLPYVIRETLKTLKKEAKARQLKCLGVALRVGHIGLQDEAEGDDEAREDKVVVVDGCVEVGAPRAGLTKMRNRLAEVGSISAEEDGDMGLFQFVEMCDLALGC